MSNHPKGLITIAANNGIKDLFLHAFTDGRDTDPKGGLKYVKDVVDHMNKTTGKLASIIGRYYTVDRDKRCGTCKKLAYDLLVKGVGEKTTDPRRPFSNHIRTT